MRCATVVFMRLFPGQQTQEGAHVWHGGRRAPRRQGFLHRQDRLQRCLSAGFRVTRDVVDAFTVRPPLTSMLMMLV